MSEETNQDNANLAMTTGPPQLPPLTEGQTLKSGPYTITVTADMVAQRERENAELRRAWLSAQRSRDLRGHHDDDSYSEKFLYVKTRRTFVRKVFCILGLQLLFTAAVIACFLFIYFYYEILAYSNILYFHHRSDVAKKFMILYWFIWVIALVTFTIFYCVLSCSDYARRQSPCNYICLLLLTISMAYLAAFVSVFYSIHIVLITAGTTACITLAISFLATFSKFDLTMRRGLVLVVGLVTIFSIILISILLSFTEIKPLSLVIATLATLLMSMYLYFDIQTIMGGRRIEVSPDEVVYATTQVYVDIILLYQYVLMFFGFVHD